ncbi:putative mitochondrial adenine nucleotide transporter BTL3 [Nicotiana tabacum]|uniref:Probable mitochondrial adenine nucleotide transporter BTL3 n=1 Tax=Nicotiana tabacum TaxID=4097 RepID=A0A1S4AB45_TOBAC|nr:PREDICTED: probable mitochondrial adenine nucleotide transporter BTL3 [Nicotiana tabacum]XP_016473889.1 PREDICTED: probable mitochondrial adenine nucleotide transporter BTL3 [Nicotiana tabacum]XP_016473890.1 PREDICTED: probable mitochondrial adenine nucleotide transporter BTL3 [Nicotiana tabacum]
MPGLHTLFKHLEESQTLIENPDTILFTGGLFLDPIIPSSITTTTTNFLNVSSIDDSNELHSPIRRRKPIFRREKSVGAGFGGKFLCLSLSVKKNTCVVGNSSECLLSNNGDESSKVEEPSDGSGGGRKRNIGLRGRRGAVNTTKHLWAGAVAAMISRTVVAPLERLKLEYIVRGEQKHLVELIKTIAATQGLRGFWKGNLVNVLRTAPFKAVNFCAFDTYRKQLLRLSGNEETTNIERFVAGAAAGVTATVMCLPLDTIRTKLVARGGEALGGVGGAFKHLIRTEGFFSLYKGLVPSILSMAPAAAVFYSVYDILKSAYLHSPEGRKRIQYMKQQGAELNALDQLELGPMRTLLHGAIAGACAEAATYPFEVIRRQLQLQGRASKLSALATCAKIVEHGGVPALYAGLIPSLLQVLPSASISYFVYEFMKIVLKVE